MTKIFVKIGDQRIPAEITGKMRDEDWNNRASKTIKVQMSYADALALFVDDITWSIVCEYPLMVDKYDENGNHLGAVEEIQIEEYNNNEYSIAGNIIDHRNGYVSVCMGAPTYEELLNMLVEGLAL